MAADVLIYLHKFPNEPTIKSLRGWRNYIAGKAVYIIKGSGLKTSSGEWSPGVICDARFNQNPDNGPIASEVTVIEGWIATYTATLDAAEDNRDQKLQPTCEWKLEQLAMNGVDLLDSVERKVWIARPDLLTNIEKDNLITEWEAAGSP